MGHLAEAVPKVFSYRLAQLPCHVSEQGAHKPLDSLDRSTPVGRRDCAMVLLLHTYGVRGSQIRALQLEDIQWRHSRIRFRSCKGGKEILDPLTDQVGELLLEYLRHGRHETAYRKVFLTDRAPFHPLNADITSGSPLACAAWGSAELPWAPMPCVTALPPACSTAANR